MIKLDVHYHLINRQMKIIFLALCKTTVSELTSKYNISTILYMSYKHERQDYCVPKFITLILFSEL